MRHRAACFKVSMFHEPAALVSKFQSFKIGGKGSAKFSNGRSFFVKKICLYKKKCLPLRSKTVE